MTDEAPVEGQETQTEDVVGDFFKNLKDGETPEGEAPSESEAVDVDTLRQENETLKADRDSWKAKHDELYEDVRKYILSGSKPSNENKNSGTTSATSAPSAPVAKTFEQLEADGGFY